MTNYQRELISAFSSNKSAAVKILINEKQYFPELFSLFLEVANENNYNTVEDFFNADLDASFDDICDCGYVDLMTELLVETTHNDEFKTFVRNYEGY